MFRRYQIPAALTRPAGYLGYTTIVLLGLARGVHHLVRGTR